MVSCQLLSLLLAIIFVAKVSSTTASENDIFFYESFDGPDDIFESGRWVKSKNAKYADQPVLIKSSDTAPPGFENDKGIILTQEMKHYGFATQFPSPLDPAGKDLVLQYEIKLEEQLTCGGAYIKMPRADSEESLDELHSSTPYTIMFGPDKCGASNKVHFILQHMNPITKEWEEKHFNDNPTVRADRNSHLYTLLIRSDNSFEIFIDKDSTRKGNLLTHMNPPINPPAEIDDPTDVKPADWVDEAKIDDPNAVKPDDWDEDAPKMIVNPLATKPKDWLDDAPLEIPDPKASKPEDWDDEEDGEWEAPVIPNPACQKSGCGEWKPDMIKNPAYKGKWFPPKIDNPAFKGIWRPKQIPNPAYFVDHTPAKTLASMKGLAVEVWTTNAGILFDNFLVAHSLEAAFQHADTHFVPKSKAQAEAARKKDKEKMKKAREDKLEKGGIRNLVEVKLSEAVEFVEDNAIAVGISLLASVVIIYFLIPNPKPKPSQPGGGNRASSGARESTSESSEGLTSDSNRGGAAEVQNKTEKEEVDEEDEVEEEEKKQEEVLNKAGRPKRNASKK